jgi:hypothetical protein
MKISWRRSWLGVGLLGSVLVMGCRHCREQVVCWDCTDCSSKPAPAPVTKAEPPKSTEGTVTIMPATHSEPQVTEVKKVKRNPGSILWTAMAPDGPGVCNPGTIEITSEEAEAMGVRPGYTPGALYIAKSGDDEQNIVEHADTKEEEKKATEAIPVKNEK